jgi:predicted CXXCH cytochrome family protein
MVKRTAFIVFVCFIYMFAFYGPVFSDETRVCLTCHSKKTAGKNVHKALEKGCIICHTQHHSKDPAAHPKGLKTDTPELCWDCHDRSLFIKKHPHTPVATGKCSFCHAAHSSDSAKLLIDPSPKLCFSCHDEKKFNNKVIHSPLSDGSCDSCHALTHGSDKEKMLNADMPELCYTCHNRELFAGKNVHAPVASGRCDFCHSPHATENRFLLNKPINEGCVACHPQAARKNTGLATRKPSFHVKVNHPLTGKKDPLRTDRKLSCTSCHDPHVSDWMRLFRFDTKTSMEICAFCHKEMEKKG